MKLLQFTAICSIAFFELVSATSRDSQSKNQEIDLLTPNFLSQFNKVSFKNLNSSEQFKTVLTALNEYIPQLNTSPVDDDNEIGLVVNANQKLVEQCYDNLVNGEVVDLVTQKRKNVVQTYFKHHFSLLKNGDVETFVKRIRALVENINYIAKRLVECIDDKKYRDIEPTKIGLTSMAAYTNEEFKQKFLNYASDKFKNKNEQNILLGSDRFSIKNCVTENYAESRDVPPKAFDWRNYTFSDGRNYSVVTAVKDQKTCGSCFVFSATGAMESAYMLSKQNNRTNQTILNEQALLNCATGDCKEGGYEWDVFLEAFYTGVTDSWETPYVDQQNECKAFPVVARTTGYCQTVDIPDDETILQVVQQKGPASVGFYAHDIDFQFLRGEWKRDCLENRATHALVMTGWDEEFFIIKNSWGTEWGVYGYLYFIKDGKERCGFRGSLSVPTF